jgi:DNA-damage-inducible protein J
MSKTSSINIRVDGALKEQAEKVISEFGLNMTTTVNMLLKQIVREQAIPLSLSHNGSFLAQDLLYAQLERAAGYEGPTGEEVADRLDAIIDEVENGTR